MGYRSRKETQCAKAVRDGVITVFGPDQWRPFVHVDDVARAIAMALQAPLDPVGGEAFNVGSDEQNFTLGVDLVRGLPAEIFTHFG